LKIVPSADIGDLGPQQGTSVTYDWKWYYGAPTLALWLALIAAFAFIKANRNPQALLILVPLLIMNLFWLMFKKAMGFRSPDGGMVSVIFHTLTVGITVLWLLAPKVANWNRLVILVLGFAVMAVFGIGAGVSHYGSLRLTEQSGGVAVLVAMLASAILLGLVLTAWQCRERYTRLRFLLYLGFWSVIASLASVLVVCLIVFAIERPGLSIAEASLELLVVGLVLGVCAYVIVLPYLILALVDPFFRQRFYACLRLRPVPPQQQDASENRQSE
jgi:hypothetical protein